MKKLLLILTIILLLPSIVLGTDTQTLDPDGDASVALAVGGSCSGHYQCVSDDSDDTYVYVHNNTIGDFVEDIYSLGNPTLPTHGAVKSVEIRVRLGGWDSSLEKYKIGLRIGSSGTKYYDTTDGTTFSDSYAWYSYTWTTNPNTSDAWTWTNVQNLQPIIALALGHAYDGYADCLELEVVVHYVSSTGYLIIRPDGDDTATSFSTHNCTGTDHADCINDQDTSNSYLNYGVSASSAEELYTFGNPTHTGDICDIVFRVYGAQWNAGTYATQQFVVKTGAVTSYGSNLAFTGTDSWHTEQWREDAVARGWTWTKVDDLVTGLKIYNSSTGGCSTWFYEMEAYVYYASTTTTTTPTTSSSSSSSTSSSTTSSSVTTTTSTPRIILVE